MEEGAQKQVAQVDGRGAAIERPRRRRRRLEYHEGQVFDADEEENFAWYDINDKDTYFVLTTLGRHAFPKG